MISIPAWIFTILIVLMPIMAGMVHPILFIFPIIGILIVNKLIWQARKAYYFDSDQFRNLQHQVETLVREHQEVSRYASELRSDHSFSLGESDTGKHAHLATFDNTSKWNYQRDKNVAEYQPHIHNASLQVVRNASMEPIKYLMKYFDIKANRESLASAQRLSENISRLEGAVENVREREAQIMSISRPPRFILRRYADEFWGRLGMNLAPISVPYPKYTFQYVSAGGNSSQTVDITLDLPTLEALSETISKRIKWAKSTAGQRALMTTKLRTWIKERDNHTCQNPACGVSVAMEPNLLIEVDHIIPISKGGLSEPSNLQALCWRCNRSKGARTPEGFPGSQVS